MRKILIVGVLLVAGTGAYFLNSNKNNSGSPLPSISPTVKTTCQSGRTIETKKNFFTINCPTGWDIQETGSSNGPGFYDFNPPYSYGPGGLGQIGINAQLKDSYDLAVQNEKNSFEDTPSQEALTVDGISGVRFSGTLSGPDNPKPYGIKTILNKDGKGFTIEYFEMSGAKNYRQAYLELVQSLKFTN